LTEFIVEKVLHGNWGLNYKV